MIRAYQLRYLIIATIILSIFAFWLNIQRNPAIPGDGTRIFPALLSHINSVQAIMIRHAGNTFHLEKHADRWLLPEKENAQVDARKVRDLLFALGEMLLVEPKTQNPALYAALNVELPSNHNTSTQIEVFNTHRQLLTSVIIGTEKPLKSNPNRVAVFIRKPKESQAWEAEAVLPNLQRPEDWLLSSKPIG